jgi:hypothetical protein
MTQKPEEYYKNNNNNNSMTNTSNANSNIQWNIWQQFQFPTQPEQNRWSKFYVAFPFVCLKLSVTQFGF